ncbi:D-glycero-beta-D-manno-heptose 1-phosphate adenylyltransferase [Candidatus Babeliales bacterium]|nr:D-glycero-beta-D-manno-heptose 1-phosphate adenylyltransferase [Candidatus Babeliales bacterium]
MKDLINFIKRGGRKNVIIVGDLMLDEYIFGSVDRISPEAPVPVVREQHREWQLGGAANVAANCRSIGFDVQLFGVINQHDRSGKKFCELLEKSNISTENLILSETRATTTKLRVMAKNHQCLRIDHEDKEPLAEKERNQLIERLKKVIKPGCMLLLSDYAKGVIDRYLVDYVVGLARQNNCIVLADPKGPDFDKYQGVHYMTPNLPEFAQIVQFFGLDRKHSLVDNARKIIKSLNLTGLMITMGEQGIHFVSAETDFHSPACKREVFDLSGAGDTVVAFLALGFAHNLDLAVSLRLANHAASIAISHLKTYSVSLEELIDREADVTEKIMYDWARLKIELEWLRSEGKRIVFTNGCFDILHAGHIHILKEAKKRGDILVVALNTDASVQRLNKGPERPINTLADRATIMSALGVVDFVTAFDQDTPREILEYLRPNVLVKGGDYKREELVGYDLLMSYGGEVYTISLVPGRSTTQTIHKLQQSQRA